jgi:AraC family transcriptional regulator, transcriptional activator of pobA
MKKPVILLHQDELKDMVVDVASINDLTEPIPTAHRDDHYMFIIQQDGYFLWELDFAKITLSGPSICFVAPGQVHRYLKFNECAGWLVFVAPSSIPNAHREMFDSYLNVNQSTSVQQDDAVFQVVALLLKISDQKSLPLQKALLTSLVETLTGLIISHIIQLQSTAHLMSGQKYHMFVCFKQLITEKYKELKQVKAYAVLLHITPLYLNEVVKEITGFSASHWINQEILLEAKRMLYYTSLDVKEIAYLLGYDDHAYFSRFFKKHTGMTALVFRNSKPCFVQS